MVHGKTLYRCGCLRFACPCHPNDSMSMTLNDLCPQHGGPPDQVNAYELLANGTVRKVKPQI
jgi:hypothetical protein